MSNRVFRAAVFAAVVSTASIPVTSANSADVYKPQAAPPPASFDPPPASKESSGWYAGGLIGYGRADTGLSAPAGSFGFDIDGAIVSGLVGWNYMNGRMLIGLEGDLTGGDMTGSQVFGANTVNASVDWMTSLRARAGVNFTPEILLFAMVGGAWAEIDLPTTGAGGGAGSKSFTGLQYGGGVEMALSGNWSARFDYLYTDLGSETVTYAGGNTVTYDPDVHQLRAGVVFKF